MKKKICQALVYWLAFILIFAIAVFWTESKIVLVGMLLWFFVPWISMGMNLYLKNRIYIDITLPVSIGKNELVEAMVTVHNKSHLPCARLYCEVIVENRLTQEKVPLLLAFHAGASGEANTSFEVRSEYCGYLYAYPSAVWLMDWIGFLPVRCRQVEKKFQRIIEEKTGCAVIPDTFQPHLYIDMVQNVREDAQHWSQLHKGNDFSEVFAMRDYLSGDSLKQIHWKLSSKRGQLIVREASLPVEKSLLLFWNKNSTESHPNEMDALEECAASVSQEILNLGYQFTIGWTEGRSIAFEDIETVDDLLQVIPRMMKYGSEISQSANVSFHQEQLSGQFGKVVYMANKITEEKEYFNCIDLVCLICGAKVAGDDCRIITFRPDHYKEDLATIEL